MDHKTTITREYADEVAFRQDEQRLGMQGWSVEKQGKASDDKDLLHRMMSRFAPAAHEPIIVTYIRSTPS